MEGADRSVEVYEIESEVQRPMKVTLTLSCLIILANSLLPTRKSMQGLKGWTK